MDTAEHYVHEAMTSPVVAVQPDVSSQETARQLAHRKIGAVPVVDASLHVVGIITESDLLTGVRPADGTARDTMTSPVVTTTAGTTLDEARAVLTTRDIGRLPVVDDAGVLIGIVSRRDLLRCLMPADVDVRHRVIDCVTHVGGEISAMTVSDGAVWIRGRVARRREIAFLERILLATPGVTCVDLDFGYAVDDTAEPSADAPSATSTSEN
jgi:CBS-domain-containing membrane protein